MQYILTQEEYDNLTCKNNGMVKVKKSELQKLCTLAANHVPVNRDWDKDNKKPWGCIHTKKGGYCDECPSKALCPSSKDFSQ